MNYYNEIDPFAASWLRELIKAGHISQGVVDERSIEDIKPSELVGYDQCHFFAGIGGWAYALRLAGWPDNRPVWTGSCPCQPFSQAGKGAGTADERHLWPSFYHLISECRPSVVFGEQVASPDGLGWLDTVQSDLEAADYACGAIDCCAAGIGAPHIRQRLWFVAESNQAGRGTRGEASAAVGYGQAAESDRGHRVTLGDADNAGLEGRALPGRKCADQWTAWSPSVPVPCADGKARPTQPGVFPLAHGVSNRMGKLRGYGNAIVPQVAAEVIRAYLDEPHPPKDAK